MSPILRDQDPGPRTFLPSQRNASDQILEVIIAPADAAAEGKRGLVEDVVRAAGDEQHRRGRLLLTKDVLAVQPQVRVVVAALAEVECFAGETEARGGSIVH